MMAGYVYRGTDLYMPPKPKVIRKGPARKTHCIMGHERTPENVDPTNRACIRCRNERQGRLVKCLGCDQPMRMWSLHMHSKRHHDGVMRWEPFDE